MKRFLILVLFIFALIQNPPAAALEEGEENELLENFMELREDLYQYQIYVSGLVLELEEKDEDLKLFFENLGERLENHVEKILRETVENVDLMLLVIDELKENLTTEIRGDLDDFEELALASVENELAALDEDFEGIRSLVRDLVQADIDRRQDKTDEAGLGMSILSLLGVFMVFFGIKTGAFSRTIPGTAKSPEERIVSALGLRDQRLELEAPREEIAAAEARLKTLREDFPKEYNETVEKIKKLQKEARKRMEKEKKKKELKKKKEGKPAEEEKPIEEPPGPGES